MQGLEHGCEVDFWALGVLVFELLTGELPYATKTHANDPDYAKNCRGFNAASSKPFMEGGSTDEDLYGSVDEGAQDNIWHDQKPESVVSSTRPNMDTKATECYAEEGYGSDYFSKFAQMSPSFTPSNNNYPLGDTASSHQTPTCLKNACSNSPTLTPDSRASPFPPLSPSSSNKHKPSNRFRSMEPLILETPLTPPPPPPPPPPPQPSPPQQPESPFSCESSDYKYSTVDQGSNNTKPVHNIRGQADMYETSSESDGDVGTSMRSMSRNRVHSNGAWRRKYRAFTALNNNIIDNINRNDGSSFHSSPSASMAESPSTGKVNGLDNTDVEGDIKGMPESKSFKKFNRIKSYFLPDTSRLDYSDQVNNLFPLKNIIILHTNKLRKPQWPSGLAISREAKSFVNSLLNLDVTERLGY